MRARAAAGAWARAVGVLWRKEARDHLASPLTWALAALFSLATGWLFFNRLVLAGEWTSGTVSRAVLQPLFGLMASLFLFLVPVLTMGSVAGERRRGTLPLLLMSHCTDGQIVVAKFLSGCLACLVLLAPTLVLPGVLAASGYGDWGLVAAGYLGVALTAACYVAAGVFASSVSGSQAPAALLCFALLLGLMLLPLAGNATGNPLLGQMLSHLSVTFHLDGFLRGVVRTHHLAFHASFTGFFLFLAARALGSRHW